MSNNNFDEQELDDFLQFHTELPSEDFTMHIVSKVGKNAKLRRNIFSLFTLLGLLVSTLIFVYFVPLSSFTDILTQLPVYAVALLVFCLMSSSLWLLSNQES